MVVLGLVVLALVVQRKTEAAHRAKCQQEIMQANADLARHDPKGARSVLKECQSDCTSTEGAVLEAAYGKLATEEKAASLRAQQQARAEQLAKLKEQQRINHMSVAQAAGEFRRLMSDTTNAFSPAMMRLAGWGFGRMTWTGLQGVPKTTYGMFTKDSASERGRLVCLRGNIAQIRRDLPGYRGILTNAWKNQTIAFIALGDTGKLVARSSARFCGIGVGRYTYATLSGGTNEAIQAVGMFDLAKNRRGQSASASRKSP